MILKQYGTSYQSVQPNFNSRAITEIAFRRDRAHAVQTALEAHDRSRAHEVYSGMSKEDPRHVLTLNARRALSAYDADTLGVLTFADQMLQRFPDNPLLISSSPGSGFSSSRALPDRTMPGVQYPH